MPFISNSYAILFEQFHLIYLQEDIKLLLVTVSNRLKFEIEIVHDLSCHPILLTFETATFPDTQQGCQEPRKAEIFRIWSRQVKR